MKILQVCDYYQYSGGTEQYLISVSKELENLGHQISIIYAIKTQDTLKIEDRPGYFLPFPVNASTKDLDIEKKLKEIVKKESPDIIYIHNVMNHYIIEKLLTLRPLIRFIHDTRLFCPSTFKILYKSDCLCDYPLSYKCIINAYKERCLSRSPITLFSIMKSRFLAIDVNKKVNKIIVASVYMKGCLEKNGFNPEKIEIIPYFVQPDNSLLEEKEGTNTILFVGRLHWSKGLQYLLQALSYVKEPFKLLVCGNGPYEEEARLLVRDLGLSEKVGFLGWVDNQTLSKYYLMSSIVVLPSIWAEPFGIVGIEAMSYAKAVVAFNVGGISEWLKDGENGFLVNRGNAKALSEKIHTFLQNKDLAVKMGKRGREFWSAKFTKEIHLKKLISIFQQCV